MKMRFRLRRLVKILTALVLLWLARYLWYSFSGFDEEDEEIEFGSPEPDTSIPESFLRSPEGLSTPVVIVEEHFEVLKYWFAASESGLLDRSGNILVHIDGHADSGLPKIIDRIPLFRPPRNVQEVNNMMQRNDIFIATAALGGLIDRYIWIWPPWDEPNHEADHVIIDIEAGSINKSGRTEICGCFRIRSDDVTSCRMRNETDPDDEGINIDSSECKFNRSGIIEFVSEGKAIELLETDDWIESQHNIILDIDEDYYGCESAGVPLYFTGLKSDTIDGISDIFSQIFCAKNTRQEMEIDRFFHSFMQLIIEIRNIADKKTDLTKKKKLVAVQQVLFVLLPDIYEALLNSPLQNILCYQGDPVVELLLQGIVRYAAKLEIKQLESFAYVGMCLSNSPKSFFYEVAESLQVCEGRVGPNSTLVLFHTPTPIEMHDRTTNLRKILKASSLTPSLVTVCRSVRDGYTPRKLFPRIEADILRELHEAFSEVHYASVYYDGDLLGHASGWHGRVFDFKNSFLYKIFQEHRTDIRQLGFLPI